MALSAPRGTQDILPEDARRWQWLESLFRTHCHRYGYGEIRTPVFESTELFVRGVGQETDIVSKQMYSFESRGGDALTLRPEGTAPTVRALIQHNLLAQGGVTKLYYLGPIFRYERPQRGRYRQFHQVGIEAYGSPGPDIDAEVLALAADFLDAAGIPGTTLELNSVGCPACRPRYRDALRTALAGARTDLCPDCERRFETNPLRILDCKIDTCRDHTRDVPVILDVLCNECHEHLAGVVAGLKRLGVAHVINPHIVRGLDYYTRTAFEFIAGGLGAQNTVLAGGRYDGLVKELGGPATPAIGFAAGIERLLMATTATDAGAAPALIYLALLGDAARAEGMRLALELRRAGVSIVHDYAGRSLKAQLKEANRLGAQVVVILGDEELAQGEAVVRQMADGAQARVALPELAAYLTTR